jgi:hypothetical protein
VPSRDPVKSWAALPFKEHAQNGAHGWLAANSSPAAQDLIASRHAHGRISRLSYYSGA